jgi:hypothetical protein
MVPSSGALVPGAVAMNPARKNYSPGPIGPPRRKARKPRNLR